MQPLVIITGLSGSGKSLAAQCFEDLGYFCVDNLPISLIPAFGQLVQRGSDEQLQNAALVIDAREREFLRQAPQVLAELRNSKIPIDLIFFECSDDTLKRRFKETRRPHPLADGDHDTLEAAIRFEREAMEPVRQMADRILDTSHYTSHQLRAYIKRAFGSADRAGLSVNLVSFGFKYGLPAEADLVFDVRFLPNPYFVETLRPLDGRTEPVQKFLDEIPTFHAFKAQLAQMLEFLLPHYDEEGKAYLSVCIGCTGGKHRSVALVEKLGDHLSERGIEHRVHHRDVGKE